MSLKAAPRTLAVVLSAVLVASGHTKSTGGAQEKRRECVMLQALDEPAPYVSDGVECAIGTAPASTFKIPHALIALDTGIVPDPLAAVKWDGTPQPFPAWERDQTLDSAMKSSVVWFFQRTAASIGRDRMRAYLKKMSYAADTFDRDLTTFWLNGDLVVSPEEQLRFLERLARYRLPVDRRHVDSVRTTLLMPAGRITNASGSHDFTLDWPAPLVVRAKTGNTTVGGERVSWLVGHIEAQNRQFVFVSRVRAIQELPGTAGAELASRRLNAQGPRRR